MKASTRPLTVNTPLQSRHTALSDPHIPVAWWSCSDRKCYTKSSPHNSARARQELCDGRPPLCEPHLQQHTMLSLLPPSWGSACKHSRASRQAAGTTHLDRTGLDKEEHSCNSRSAVHVAVEVHSNTGDRHACGVSTQTEQCMVDLLSLRDVPGRFCPVARSECCSTAHAIRLGLSRGMYPFPLQQSDAAAGDSCGAAGALTLKYSVTLYW
jgi:hypothetical protein